jgi:hypothetical protein
MITLVLTRTRAAMRARTRHAAYHPVVAGSSVKDLSAFPVCGSVRPLASQRAVR